MRTDDTLPSTSSLEGTVEQEKSAATPAGHAALDPSAARMPDLAANVAAAMLPFRANGLISAASRARIAAVATLLPAAASDFFGFECRLGEPDEECDFLACIAAEDGEREAWVRGLPPAGLEEHPAWRQIANFARAWADPASVLHQPIVNMWVEFDLIASNAMGPSVFFGSEQLGPHQADPSAHAWLPAAIERLGGAPAAEERRRTIARCLAALPAEGRLFQIGMMLSRPDPVLRLCFRGIAATEIPDFLRTIGWRGQEGALRALTSELAPRVDRIHVDLDLDIDLRDKVGLECYLMDDSELPARLSAWLDYLRGAGLSTETKARALAAWYGLTHERWCRERWPSYLRNHAGRPGPRHSGGFMRTLNHVKLVVDPPRPLEVKAYLACRFVWIDDLKLKQALAKQELGENRPIRPLA